MGQSGFYTEKVFFHLEHAIPVYKLIEKRFVFGYSILFVVASTQVCLPLALVRFACACGLLAANSIFILIINK